MLLLAKDIWNFPPNKKGLVIVTTNGMLRSSNQHLVMGGGAAKEARDRIQGVETLCGKAIVSYGTQEASGEWRYGFLPISQRLVYQQYGFGIFQTKYHWQQKSDLNLIRFSTEMLCAYALEHSDQTFQLNYPGVGLGGLIPNDVFPIIRTLPANVIVCYK